MSVALSHTQIEALGVSLYRSLPTHWLLQPEVHEHFAHTQTHGVTHTDNRMDLKEVITGSGSQPLGLPGFCLLALFIPFFLPDPT